MRGYSVDEIDKMWSQAAAELRNFAGALEEKSGLTAAQLRMAIQMADSYQGLREAAWPGKPEWRPTPEQPQQDFYEAFAESLHVIQERERKLHEALEKYVEWHGAAHEVGCPQDDTCDCKGKSVNELVNCALKQPEMPDWMRADYEALEGKP
jgi:hypothetical protein